MQVSEKRQTSLNSENSELFKQQANKFQERKLTIDLKVIEDNEENILSNEKVTVSPNFDEILGEVTKNKGFPIERKNSTCSTSISKVDDFSELNFPIGKGKTPCQKNISNIKGKEIPSIRKQHSTNLISSFFGRENSFNAIRNYLRETEEYIKNSNEEANDYTKSKNYVTKESLGISENKNEINNFEFDDNQDFSETIDMNLVHEDSTPATPTTSTGNFSSMSMPTVMNTITPKYSNWGKGKFDLPMYCFGFYNVESKSNYFINIIFLS